MIEPTPRRFASQRLELAYWDWGNREAPPLILLHGGRDHARSWDPFARVLAADWRVIAADLRGHGDSAWSPEGAYEMHTFVADLAELVDHLGAGEVSLVGHSFGGNIATRYAGLYPERVRRLVNLEGLGPAPAMRMEREAVPFAERFHKWLDEKRAAIAKPRPHFADLDAAIARMRAAHPRLSEAEARHVTEHALQRDRDGAWVWKHDPLMNAWSPFDMTYEQLAAAWGAIACPVLLLYAADSWTSNPERDGRAALLRDARVIEFENADHWLHYDQPERFLAELRAFL